MKKLIAVVALAVAAFGLSGCGDETINGKTYQSYGLFNEDAVKDPKVLYEVSAESVIVAIIFSETIIVPVYVVGWDLFTPVRVK